jgi:D-alanyl-D-alanine carboxypeptidase
MNKISRLLILANLILNLGVNDSLAETLQPKKDSTQRGLDSTTQELANRKSCKVLMKLSIQGGKTYYSGYDGRAKKPVNDFKQTIDIGSCSKIFTATSILQLVEQGKLSLYSKLVDVLPNDTLYKGLAVIEGKDYLDSVTIYQMLNHTTGFPDYFVEGDDEGEFKLHGDSSLRFRPEELVSLAKRTNKPKNIPGAEYHYSNTNYILLGKIIEKITGITYHAYVQKNIIEPLHLKHTYFGSLNPPKKRSEGHYKGKISVMPATMAWSAGEIISTLDDMQTFIDAWYAGKLFNDPATLLMVKKDAEWPIPSMTMKYGLGIMDLMGKCLGHGGQTFGFQSFMGITAKNNTIVIGVDDASVSVFEPLIPMIFIF